MCPGRTLNYWADENERHLDFTQLVHQGGRRKFGECKRPAARHFLAVFLNQPLCAFMPSAR